MFSLKYFNKVEKEAREGMGKDRKAASMGAALTEDRVHFLTPGMGILHTRVAAPFGHFNKQILLLQV